MKTYIIPSITFHIAQSGNRKFEGAGNFLYANEPLVLEMMKRPILVRLSRSYQYHSRKTC